MRTSGARLTFTLFHVGHPQWLSTTLIGHMLAWSITVEEIITDTRRQAMEQKIFIQVAWANLLPLLSYFLASCSCEKRRLTIACDKSLHTIDLFRSSERPDLKFRSGFNVLRHKCSRIWFSGFDFTSVWNSFLGELATAYSGHPVNTFSWGVVRGNIMIIPPMYSRSMCRNIPFELWFDVTV